MAIQSTKSIEGEGAAVNRVQHGNGVRGRARFARSRSTIVGKRR